MTRTTVPAMIALLTAAVLSGAAHAQAPDRPYYGPYSVYGPGLTYRQPDFYYGPLGTTFLRAQTTVTVPDGGAHGWSRAMAPFAKDAMSSARRCWARSLSRAGRSATSAMGARSRAAR